MGLLSTSPRAPRQRFPASAVGAFVGAGLLLAGCEAHLGLLPTVRAVGDVAVLAPTVELAVADDVLAAVDAALAARGAAADGGEAMLVFVDAATFDPFAGAGGVRVYRARLAARFELGGVSHRVERVREVPDPGSASAATGVRREVLRALADDVAADAASWVVSLPAR